MDGSRTLYVQPQKAANEPVKAICREDSACFRWKRYGLPACEGLCARRVFLDSLPYKLEKR